MVQIDEVKKDVLKSIDYARKKAKDFLEKDLDCTDFTRLTNVLSATEESRAMALTLTKLFPGDASIESLWREATAAYNLGYKGSERFTMKCKCENRR
jgi:hypothetical protein